MSLRNMERRLVETKEVVRKLITEVEYVWKENEALKAKNGPLGEGTVLSQADRSKQTSRGE